MTAEDHSFPRLLTQTESGGELVRHSRGAYEAMCNTTSAFWGRKSTVLHSTSNCGMGRRHSGGAWPVPVENRVFLGEEGALFGGFIGIPGANSRHSGGT